MGQSSSNSSSVTLCEMPRSNESLAGKNSSIKLRHYFAVSERSSAGMATLENRAQRYIQALTIPVEHLQRMVESFINELQLGLSLNKNKAYQFDSSRSCFKMLDAMIERTPSSREKGMVYALDFGGTNFRVVRMALDGNGGARVTQTSESLLDDPATKHLSRGLMDASATATQLFDFFAIVVKEFMSQMGDLHYYANSNDKVPAGLTFSYPCAQKSIGSAVLIEWTKGFETGRKTNDRVEGTDICRQFNEALKRHNVPLECIAVANDTVGTLLSCAYELNAAKHAQCSVGVILGTGVNCAYVEPRAHEYGYKGKIVNVECGNFNRDLPRIDADIELDSASSCNAGFQQLEKMVSGAYLGEIARRVIVKVFQYQAPALAWEPDSLQTADVASIANDVSDPTFAETKKILSERWETVNNWPKISDLIFIRRICSAVMERSAALAAVLIVGCAKKTGQLVEDVRGLTVGIDGSVYARNQFYQEKVRAYIDLILGDILSNRIKLVLADDGSGKGVGILAALQAGL